MGFRVGLVVFGDGVNISAPVSAKDGPTVPHIGNIAGVIDDEDYYGTAAASFDWVLRFCKGKELLLSLLEAKLESVDGLVGEVCVFGDLSHESST